MADYDNPRPTSQPIGSTDLAVAKDNLITLDRMVSGASGTPVTNRKGEALTPLVDIIDSANSKVNEAIGASFGVFIGNYPQTYTNYNQYTVFNGQQYGIKTPSQGGPALPYTPTEADPANDANLKIYGDASQSFVREAVTVGQEELIGGQIYPEIGDLENGMTVTSGTTHLRVAGQIYAMLPLASGLVANLTSAGATIGGITVEFQPMSKLTPLKRVIDRSALSGFALEGRRVEWLGYYEPSDGGSNWGVVFKGPHVEDGGSIFSIDSNTYIKANHPNSLLKYGVKTSSGTLNLQEAANNRKQAERMLRNQEISYFIFNNQGTVNILGSIHPLRVNIEIDHRKGCHIAGYLKDPAFPDVLSGGHLFGFAQYQNPDDPNDPNRFTVTGPTTDLHYKLSGTIETVFRAEHTEPHNNNCLGFSWAENCSVTGKGGVTGSDHRGINFDYDADNCIIDVGFINNTSNEPALMRGKPDNRSEFNKVKIRSVETLFDAGIPGNYRVIDITNTNRAVVQINSMKQNSVVKPNLVNVFNCGLATVEVGSIRNVAQCVRFNNSESLVLNGVVIENAECLVARAGDNLSEMKNIVITDVTCKGALPAIYKDDRASNLKTNGFKLLSVQNCDFSDATGATSVLSGVFSASNAKVYSLKDNATHASWSSPQIFNELSYSEAIATSTNSFTYDIAGVNKDYPYSKLQGRITKDPWTYQFEFDLTLLARSSYPQVITVFDTSGTRMKVTAQKGAGQLVTFTLDNAGTGASFGDIVVKN